MASSYGNQRVTRARRTASFSRSPSRWTRWPTTRTEGPTEGRPRPLAALCIASVSDPLTCFYRVGDAGLEPADLCRVGPCDSY
jgi:hypothetical protein